MKYLFKTLLALSLACTSYCQSARYIHPSLIELDFSLSNYENDFTGSIRKMDAGIGISFIKGINNHVDWKFALNGSYPDSIMKSANKNADKAMLLEFDAALRVRIFANDRRFQPYAQVGVGLSKYKDYYESYIPAGIGLQVSVWRDVYTIINSQYRIAITGTANHHFFHSIGIAGPISKRRQLPPAKKLVEIPQTIFIVRDTDQDGIVDTADNCPEQAGLLRFNGCPDTDSDGIPDKDDRCPRQFGVAKYHGCPVPDRDNDGVNDEQDKCIDIPGLKENAGCPQIAKEIQQLADISAKQVYFKTGSADLLPESYAPLNLLIKVLTENPRVNLEIQGHTDNAGFAEANQLLSERRAQSVLSYLTNHGVPPQRLSAKGFGQQKPIAENKTAAGRRKNRRVELNLFY